LIQLILTKNYSKLFQLLNNYIIINKEIYKRNFVIYYNRKQSVTIYLIIKEYIYIYKIYIYIYIHLTNYKY